MAANDGLCKALCEPSYMPSIDSGRNGGGSAYSNNPTEPTLDDYANVFGPSVRKINYDPLKCKRHSRWQADN